MKAARPAPPKKSPGSLEAEELRARSNKLTDAERKKLRDAGMRLFYRFGEGPAPAGRGTSPGLARKTEGTKIMKTTDDIRPGSGNVFADLGLPDAGELNAKAQIAFRICQILDERKLTQKGAAEVLGVDQPKISALMRGRLDGFSTDRLFRFLTALDRNVEIVIKRKKNLRTPASIRVLAPA